jgi:ankyrin repeat protein
MLMWAWLSHGDLGRILPSNPGPIWRCGQKRMCRQIKLGNAIPMFVFIISVRRNPVASINCRCVWLQPDESGRVLMADKKIGDSLPELLLAVMDGDIDAINTALAKTDINICDADGWTALHLAARNGNVDIVRTLLSCSDVDVNAKNKWKSTPLMIAATSGNLDVVEMLLRHPRTAIDMQAEYYGRTALIEAAVKGYMTIVKTLVANGADVNKSDKTGRNSALIEAIKNRHLNIAKYLLRSGLVNFDNRDFRLQALIWSSREGDALRAELDAAMASYFSRGESAAS